MCSLFGWGVKTKYSVYSTHLDFGGIPSPSLSVPSLPSTHLRSRPAPWGPPLISSLLPFLPLEVPPLRLGDLGKRVSSPVGPGGAQPTNLFSCDFRHKFASFWIISCVYCPWKESFHDIFVICCPGRKKIWSTQFGSRLMEGGNCKFFWGGVPPPPPPEDVWNGHWEYSAVWVHQGQSVDERLASWRRRSSGGWLWWWCWCGVRFEFTSARTASLRFCDQRTHTPRSTQPCIRPGRN